MISACIHIKSSSNRTRNHRNMLESRTGKHHGRRNSGNNDLNEKQGANGFDSHGQHPSSIADDAAIFSLAPGESRGLQH